MIVDFAGRMRKTGESNNGPFLNTSARGEIERLRGEFEPARHPVRARIRQPRLHPWEFLPAEHPANQQPLFEDAARLRTRAASTDRAASSCGRACSASSARCGRRTAARRSSAPSAR